MGSFSFRLPVAIAVVASALAGCGGGSSDTPGPSAAATRTYRMGFSAIPSRLDTTVLLNGIDMWSQRAELAIIHDELPWGALLAGTAPDTIIDQQYTQLVALYRMKGLRLVYVFDLDDGLSLGEDAPQLRALGRSIAEPAVQAAYRSWVLAVDRKLKPDYVGLGAETNLIRLLAPAPLYGGAVAAANGAAADLRGVGTAANGRRQAAWPVATSMMAGWPGMDVAF